MWVIECVPAAAGAPAVEPCGTVAGQAYVPVMSHSADAPPLDYSGIGALFSFSVSIVLIAFVVGLTIGAIARVIKSA